MSYRVAVLMAVVLLRLWELWFSRENLRQAREKTRAHPVAEPYFPLMVLFHGAWLAGCFAEALFLDRAFQSWLVLPTLGLWIAALVLRVWMLTSMGTLWNVRVIDRPRQPVVTSGPYRLVRHPNYLAVIVEITVVPLMVGAYWTALLATIANGFVLWERIRREEAHLFQLPEYRAAFGEKKRFIPGVF
ncbi:MAG: hypothetical protein IIA14_09225 [SAR324 cluster bacterium]|nr:hypothetical protein [SAR324 cluster bacterium]